MISRAPSVGSELIEGIVGRRQPSSRGLEVISDGVETVFERCDVIMAASGTVTLQAALHGTPMAITYKVSPVSAWLARALVRVPHVGLVNLVAGRELAPELLQDDATGGNLARTILKMLEDKDELNDLRRQLISLRDVLGGRGASDRVAELALGMIDS